MRSLCVGLPYGLLFPRGFYLTIKIYADQTSIEVIGGILSEGASINHTKSIMGGPEDVKYDGLHLVELAAALSWYKTSRFMGRETDKAEWVKTMTEEAIGLLKPPWTD